MNDLNHVCLKDVHEQEEELNENEVVAASTSRNNLDCVSVASGEANSDSDSDSDYIPELELSTSTSSESDSAVDVNRNMIKVHNVGIASDRYNISNQATAVIASETQESYAKAHGIKSNPIDKHKIFRARVKTRLENVASNDEEIRKNNLPMRSFYFDGKKNYATIDGKRSKKPIDHIVILLEPKSKFAGHIIPPDGKAETITDSLQEFFKIKHFSLDDLCGIGADGPHVNTGNKSGVIALFEKRLGRELHYLICMFHLLELLLKHLFEALDGVTKGPNAYAGDIGSKFPKAAELPVAKFKPISMGELPENFDHLYLRGDQRHLFELALAIASGYCSPELARRTLAPTCEARWLTKASRILRIYISTGNPSEELSWLTTFILKIYVPCWMRIKVYPYFFHGARHLFFIIKGIHDNFFCRKARKPLLDCLNINGYYGHSEMIISAMITDESTEIRKKGFEMIAKERLIRRTTIRKFKIGLNFSAVDMFDMLREKKHIFEPPCTKHFTDAEIEFYMNSNDRVVLPFLPCHSQAVEYHVQAMSNACKRVENKYVDGYMLNKLNSRMVMPEYGTKNDFKSMRV